MAHAATVGAAQILPDAAMRSLWPSIFDALGAAAPGGFLDLVHASHELSRGRGPEWARIVGVVPDRTGYSLDVASGGAGARSRDVFFVRQPGAAPLAGTVAPERDADWQDRPHLALGQLHTSAPDALEPFALATGDCNPIHRSDLVARLAGLPGRIVHGMWTSAFGQRAVVELACDHDPERMTAWHVTFAAPVLPGAAMTATVARTGAGSGNRRVEVTIEADGELVATGVATVRPPRTAYLFPGQGIQHVGMGMASYARSDAARAVWQRSDRHCRQDLGFSILTVVRENPTSVVAGVPGEPDAHVTYRHPAGVLNLTQFTQVAMATLASAQVAELREAGVFDEDAVTAGHSVGEYNALAAVTGALSLEAVLDLVFARGTAMHHLVPRAADGSSDYRLGVVRPHLAGLDHAATEALVAAVAAETGELCEVVNHNLRGRQYAVAGTVRSLDLLERRLGSGTKPPFLLVPGIDVPFHSSALRAGVDEFRTHLERHLPAELDPALLAGRYVPNLYPRPFRVSHDYVAAVRDTCGSPVLTDVLEQWHEYSASRIARILLVELLAWQFASPVRWIETTDVLCGTLDVQRIVEVGVGEQPTLTNLAKGAVAQPDHRGTSPAVLNIEADSDAVFERTEPAPEPSVELPALAEAREANQSPPPGPALAEALEANLSPPPGPALAEALEANGRSLREPQGTGGEPAGTGGARAGTVPDRPVDHATALLALVALRTGVRLDQLGDDSIETLVDGASSRRNQLLMDLGKEFAVSGMDGAHEAPLDEVAAGLGLRARTYRFPGPVLGTWLDAELGTTLGRLASTRTALADRVSGHWALGAGWARQVELELALGRREGGSRRGGDLATLDGTQPTEVVDAAVRSAADRLGVDVSPAAAAASGTVDAAAVAAATERFESLLADSAEDLLARLDRGRAEPAVAAALAGEARTQRLATLDAELGAERASAVVSVFDARRHVHLESGAAWARADVEHLVHAAARGADDLQPLIEQITLHRDHDARIPAMLQWFAGRAESFGTAAPAVRNAVTLALTAEPAGIAVPLTGALAALDRTSPGIDRLAAAAESLTHRPGAFAGQVALVTGASPSSIAFGAVKHLLRGGATVVLVTSTDTPERIEAYRDLERRCAGPGAQLHVVRANLASFTDIDGLVEWLTTPTTATVGASTREVKPALWPTVLLPFAAGPAAGSLADTGSDSELGLRLMLLGVQRLVGTLGEQIVRHGAAPMRVVLPLSPNHGMFGGDGSYADAKAALETVVQRWSSEQHTWGSGVRLVATEIGWVRGTGLMAAIDSVAGRVEQRLGVHTFSADEMGTLVAAACAPDLADLVEAPWRVDLTGGLGDAGGVSECLRSPTADPSATPLPALRQAQEPLEGSARIPALPNLAWTRAPDFENTFAVAPDVDLDDMVVIAGIAELGPWGASATRHEAELGDLSADAVAELAWRMGLVSWDRDRASWVDGDDGELAEHEVFERLADVVAERVGVRELEITDGVAADGTVTLREVYLDRATTIAGVAYPAGTAIRVPERRPLQRQVGGQFPTGVDPTRHGLDGSVAQGMDPLAAWNLVVTAEALAAAGIEPEELREVVHPGLIANTQGTGMGGMGSLHALYLDPVLGRSHANDLLQEALGNVVSAHVNQSLVGGYGPMVHPVAACATAAVSLEEALDKIRLGKADVVIGGGWDDLSSEGVNGFADMSATADNADLIASGVAPRGHSRPGDRRRRGFVEAQGGGSFVVTRGSVALRLGLPVRAVVAYAGSYGDGVQTSIPAPGLGALGAARGGPRSPLATALARHGLTPDDVAVVSKHDTSTAANDPNEALLHATIAEQIGRSPGAPLRVISQKSVTGHAKGGAAAWQLAGLCDVFESGVVPGNPNLTSVDPEVTPGPIVVDHRRLQRAEPVRAAVLTSLGFGHVSALVALAHPAVFDAAVPDGERADYARRSAERSRDGRRRLLRARYGGPPVFRRRTERMARQDEIALLLARSGS